MARTITELFNIIVAEKGNQAALADLTSTSAVAKWRLWAWVHATAQWVQENFWDLYKLDVEAVAASSFYGHEQWWVDKAYEFQYGDDLQVVTVNGVKILKYATIDVSKQIIKRASIKSGSNGVSFLKVATTSGADVIALTAPQQTAFLAYVKQIMPPGSHVSPNSESTDKARYYITIYYNALLVLADIKTAVEDAINNYHDNLDFDGVVRLSQLTDAIQAVPGVKDYEITDAQATSSVGTYTSFARIYGTKAGYIQIDPAFPLSATLIYTPS